MEVSPKSVFQIGGAGAVGTGSLRGMPILKRLKDAGFAVWPFDAPRWPCVIEIYPRLLTGTVNKTSADARAAYLVSRYPSLGDEMTRRAMSSEDAFDAAVSALAMDAVRWELKELAPIENSRTRQEGQIWVPYAGPPMRDHSPRRRLLTVWRKG